MSCWGVEPGGGLGVLPSVELATAGFGAVNLDAECVLGWWFGMNLRGGMYVDAWLSLGWLLSWLAAVGCPMMS